MKSNNPIVNKTKTASILDFSEEVGGLDDDKKSELLTKIGDLLVEEILSSCADQRSAVSGDPFAKLSKQYAAIKEQEVGTKDANLDFTGDMLRALDFSVKGNKIELGVYGADAPKADGHNNLSGDSHLPLRNFLPNKGEGFSEEISSLIKDTISAFIADNVSLRQEDLSAIKTKTELYDYLRKEIGDFSRTDLRRLALQSRLAIDLQDADLIDLL